MTDNTKIKRFTAHLKEQQAAIVEKNTSLYYSLQKVKDLIEIMLKFPCKIDIWHFENETSQQLEDR